MAHENRVNFSRAAQAGQRARRRISGRTPKLNLETEITRNVDALSQSPFDPQFSPAPQFTRAQFVAPERPEFRTERGIPNVGELDAAIARIRGRKTGTSAGELAGLEGLFEAADPTSRLAEVRKQLETVIGPEALNRAIAGGFGRGPAAAEATTRAGAALTLPILESSFAAKGLANQFKVALEQAKFSREQSQQRDLLDSVLNKVQAGISIESLNAQERQVLAQFNLSAAGQESQFNLAQAGTESQFDLNAAGLQSEREIARSNIGLSAQDRTLALLNQLRSIRTGQAQINAGLAGRGGGGAGGVSGPSLGEQAESRRRFDEGISLKRSGIAAAERQAGFDRNARESAARRLRLDATPSFSGGGINDPGGTGAARPSTSPLNSGVVITNRSLTGKKATSPSFAKPLNVSSTFF